MKQRTSQVKPWPMIGRALRLRCPACGNAPMFRKWIIMRDRCAACNFRFDRYEHDYFIGAYTINLIVAELIVVGVMVAVMLTTWPDVPWDALKWGLVAGMIPAPLVLYPFSKALWLAIDLTFQPPIPAEFEDPPQSDTR